jgi:hypothetical protein
MRSARDGRQAPRGAALRASAANGAARQTRHHGGSIGLEDGQTRYPWWLNQRPVLSQFQTSSVRDGASAFASRRCCERPLKIRSHERHAIKGRRHGPIGGIARILSIDDLSHASQGFVHVFLINDSMMQPVGNVLALAASGFNS